MKSLALNIMDIVQNSIRADASLIKISIEENTSADYLEIKIEDNGKGMNPELLKIADDPFTTTRQTRKIGLGLPLLKFHAELTGGHLQTESTEGAGTSVTARFGLSHPDRQPLGDMAGIMVLLITSNPGIDFEYRHSTGSGIFSVSAAELKNTLEIERLEDPRLLNEVKEYINVNLGNIGAGENS